jgi:NAD+ kinase
VKSLILKGSKVNSLILVTGHFERPKVKRLAKKAEKLLHNFGAGCLASDIREREFNSPVIKAVIAVGGDGTLLKVVREMKSQTPVVGIAAGTKCRLMAIKENSLEKALKKIALGKYSVEKRMRLQANIAGKKMPPALNEAMVVNRESGSLARLFLKVNNRGKGLVEADSLIIATPTGSTGHSFSAGGKRLKPGSGKIAVVAGNSLNRGFNPLYLGKNSRIVVSGIGKRKHYEVVGDGRVRKALKGKLAVKKGKDALFLRI